MSAIIRMANTCVYSVSKAGISLIFCLIFLFNMPSCTHDPFLSEEPIIEDSIPDVVPIGSGCDTSILYFTRDILPIFRTHCAISGCHDNRTAQEGYVFTDYAKIIRKGLVSGNPDNSEVYKRITAAQTEDIMPPAPNAALSTVQIALINRWVREGLKNDTCSVVAAGCDTVEVSFGKNIQPIFNQCIGCHGPITNYSGIRLDNYQGAKAALGTGRLLGAINWRDGFIRMPLDLPQLLGCDIKKIEIWARNGALDN